MTTRPSGTITFLFTDIEGSTALWQEQPKAMQAALARHDALLREVIETQGGYVFKTVGDAFCAAFGGAPVALTAAQNAQRALHSEDWGDIAELRVRMALHTGEAEERDGDYFGPVLNRCARLLGIGHGEQILLSAPTYELVRDELPDGISLRDLGDHRLRDLARPEHVYQAIVEGLQAEFPPLRSLETFDTNLPIRRTRFVGRENELAEVERIMDETRLLTLTGPGGSGKTRLALQVAADELDECPDGVWWVDLAPLSAGEIVPRTAAAVFGLREEEDRPATTVLLDYLRARRLLLVVDNCEHVVDAVAELSELVLSQCPDVRILATSREALGVEAEAVWVVPTLSVPTASEAALATPDQLGQYESVELFIDRALAATPGFRVTNDNAPAVAEICHRLDGIPLAIELAAARVRTLSAESIHARLDERFRLLTGGPRTVMPRQQTLQATIDWSYDLLSAKERDALVRSSVFHGGWDLEAAEAVCSGDGIDPYDVLDLLSSLADKSMIVLQRGEGDGNARYRMLETIRQYALERISASDALTATKARHAQHFAGLAERARPELASAKQMAWMNRLETEHQNLLAAIGEAIDGDDLRPGLRIAAALWEFWLFRRYQPLVKPIVRELLAREDAREHGAPWVGSVLVHASLAVADGDLVSASDEYALALESSAALGDHRLMGWAERGLGLIASRRQQHDEARAHMLRARDEFNAASDLEGAVAAANGLGWVSLVDEDYDAARSYYGEALDLAVTVGDRIAEARCLHELAIVARHDYEPATAQRLQAQALSIHRQLGDRYGLVFAQLGTGQDALWQGNLEEARSIADACVESYRDLGYEPGLATALSFTGVIAWQAGEYAAARAHYEESLGYCQRDDAYIARTWVLARLGLLDEETGRYDSARSYLSRALRVALRSRFYFVVPWCLLWLAETSIRQGRLTAAQKTIAKGLELHRQPMDEIGLLARLGEIHGLRGEFELAEPKFAAALEIAEKTAQAWVVPWCGLRRGQTLIRQGQLEEAVETFVDVRSEGARFGAKPFVAGALLGLATISTRRGEPEDAAPKLIEAAGLYADMGALLEQAETLELRAELAALSQDWEGAARMAGAAASIREDIGAPKHEIDRPPFDEAMADARAALGESKCERASAAGREMTFEEALELT